SSSFASPSACASRRRRRSPPIWRDSRERAPMRDTMPSRFATRIVTATVIVAAGLFGASSASWSQPRHGHAGGHQAAGACSAEFDQVVGEGRGFGLAFAADQNGYPGPMHVLELKERLKLTTDQEAKAQALVQAMFAESKPKSARLLEAEAKLRRLFADKAADDAAVRAAVGGGGRARTQGRLRPPLRPPSARRLPHP